ncbi:MAG: 3,4-dihydroxy-2-butanone-4-phosphate synthase [Phycisphaeraceae bacterium]|nr:3,4-dihydroxy-2-butanone-4-phosphate synthase [Phycisphaerales bacterium]QOJ16231.1 MAG: 3,4-dihydroxy-2-butanone-4-phosphate synthase [Phycisphaeraceae bacterium]
MPFAPIEDILADLRAGRMIVLVDNENRENEGDLVCAGELITPEIIRFMTRHTPGYLCLAMTAADCDRLDLHPQTGINTSLRGTAMAVSIDGHPRHGVGTGISASDRAKTVRIAVDPNSRPDDLVRPGHMVPLRAREGGVLVRTGQTEGSVDLARLAGCRPAAVISEISRDDGEMARLPELEQFCAAHGLKMCSVEQIIEYRLARERLVERLEPKAGTVIETPQGSFNLIAFRTAIDPLPHVALTVGGVGDLDALGHPVRIDEPVLVRMHRRDLLGDVFEELSNPTRRDLLASMRMIQQARRGAIVYLRPEGYGNDLRSRLLRLQRHATDDVNTPDLTRPEGVGGKAQPMDQREIGVGVQILLDLGLTRLRILTNHPKTLPGLHAFGLEVVEQVGIG